MYVCYICYWIRLLIVKWRGFAGPGFFYLTLKITTIPHTVSYPELFLYLWIGLGAQIVYNNAFKRTLDQHGNCIPSYSIYFKLEKNFWQGPEAIFVFNYPVKYLIDIWTSMSKNDSKPVDECLMGCCTPSA